MPGSREWDAATYDRVSSPQLEWAGAVVDRLALEGAETVLDAGCGSGRVSELLLDRLPRGRVVAVDGSAAMTEAAAVRFAERREEAVAIHCDLLSLDQATVGEVDAVFSNAVFHWIPDHQRLFARLFDILAEGGRMVAQCGGEGNVAAFYAAAAAVSALPSFDEHLSGFDPTHFAAPDETSSLLEAAGFVEVECRSEPRPVHPPEPREFIRAVCLGAHFERLPAELREPFLDAVMERLGPGPELDYVRLNISARKPGPAS